MTVIWSSGHPQVWVNRAALLWQVDNRLLTWSRGWEIYLKPSGDTVRRSASDLCCILGLSDCFQQHLSFWGLDIPPESKLCLVSRTTQPKTHAKKMMSNAASSPTDDVFKSAHKEQHWVCSVTNLPLVNWTDTLFGSPVGTAEVARSHKQKGNLNFCNTV